MIGPTNNNEKIWSIQTRQKPRYRFQPQAPEMIFEPLKFGVISPTEHLPKILTLKINIGNIYNTQVHVLVKMGIGYNILIKNYLNNNGLNMELIGNTTLDNISQRFFDWMMEHIWLFDHYILQEFLIINIIPGIYVYLFVIPFITTTNPDFYYRPDGNVDCTITFNDINIRVCISRSLR